MDINQFHLNDKVNHAFYTQFNLPIQFISSDAITNTCENLKIIFNFIKIN